MLLVVLIFDSRLPSLSHSVVFSNTRAELSETYLVFVWYLVTVQRVRMDSGEVDYSTAMVVKKVSMDVLLLPICRSPRENERKRELGYKQRPTFGFESKNQRYQH